MRDEDIEQAFQDILGLHHEHTCRDTLLPQGPNRCNIIIGHVCSRVGMCVNCSTPFPCATVDIVDTVKGGHHG